MDMVYRPREDGIAATSARKGIETISGIEMFLAQGFAQYEIWTGERAPEAAMRRAIGGACGGRKISREAPRRTRRRRDCLTAEIR